ncbi:MAG: alpha/beta fold hydrolase [Deltaproteobacteria bacterium]|nr:alpha/beta fold hydrolase [Deltaproteobacteria bacterium]MBW2396668.1 alpha/beta fold hydrolase [Deltaproteobacteria bacterium]
MPHVHVDLALHTLRNGEGPPLLLLHGLGERSPGEVPAEARAWPGPIHALDFTGHGESSIPAGGGYTAEVLMGDAAAALGHLGRATLLGRGLGAYIALLLAGARPKEVLGVVLCDGLGLAGGGREPGSSSVVFPNPEGVAPPDPFALAELARDVRPPDYATAFVRQATQLSGLDQPISVACADRPEWLEAVVLEPGVVETSPEKALAAYAKLAQAG